MNEERTRACFDCAGEQRIEDRNVEVIHGEGVRRRVLEARVPTWVCGSCEETSDAPGAEEAIFDTLATGLRRLSADTIRKTRGEQGLSQAALAAQVPVDRTTLARWEGRQQLQSAEHDRSLRKALGLPAAWDPRFRTDVERRRPAAKAFRLMPLDPMRLQRAA